MYTQEGVWQKSGFPKGVELTQEGLLFLERRGVSQWRVCYQRGLPRLVLLIAYPQSKAGSARVPSSQTMTTTGTYTMMGTPVEASPSGMA